MSFSTTFTVEATPAEAYAGITNPRGWWSAEIEGCTAAGCTHHGLVSEYECYDICVNAWGFYLRTSLPELITTGTGRPNSNGTHQVPEEAVLS